MSAAATFPRPALLGAAALVAMSVAAASIGSLTGPLRSAPPPAALVAARAVRFADQADGGVRITDAATGALVEIVPPGTNGFLRALVRGLARERKMDDDGQAAPFRVTAWADGRITLDDTATGQRVDLEAFGPTNAAAFVRLLSEGSATR